MPWDVKYRRPTVTGVTARAIDVVIESGEAAPLTPIGINLPNDQVIREQYGSKSVSLSNVLEAYDKSQPAEFQARVLLVARGAGARRALGQLRERDRDQSPRGRRPRLGRRRRASARESAGGAAGALFGDRGDARRSGRAVFHRRSEDGGAGADRRGASRRRGARRIRRLRAHGARAAAAAARGRDDRGRSHAQPSGDRALADGEHVRHRAPHA